MVAELNSKQHRTLERIFQTPTPSDIRSDEVKTLIKALGGEVSVKGRTSGSRIRIYIGEAYLNMHDPHPEPVLCKAAVKDLKIFFERIGIEP